MKDLSLAFSEGWCTALSAMVFDPDINYVDAGGTRQQSTLNRYNLEEPPIELVSIFPNYFNNPGWYSEGSIAKILYDLYDSTNLGETFDNVNLGIGPLYDLMIGAQKTTTAPTSIFSFIHFLKQANPAVAGDIDLLVANEGIGTIAHSIDDEYGTGEIQNGSNVYNLPISNQLVLGGSAVTVYLWGASSDSNADLNSAWNNRYFRFIATSAVTRLSSTASDSFKIQIFNQGTLATVVPSGIPDEVLTPASWTYAQTGMDPIVATLPDIATIPGQEYFVRVTVDKNILYSGLNLNNITVSLTGIAL
jgi:hypothetical protein